MYVRRDNYLHKFQSFIHFRNLNSRTLSHKATPEIIRTFRIGLNFRTDQLADDEEAAREISSVTLCSFVSFVSLTALCDSGQEVRHFRASGFTVTGSIVYVCLLQSRFLF